MGGSVGRWVGVCVCVGVCWCVSVCFVCFWVGWQAPEGSKADLEKCSVYARLSEFMSRSFRSEIYSG